MKTGLRRSRSLSPRNLTSQKKEKTFLSPPLFFFLLDSGRPTHVQIRTHTHTHTHTHIPKSTSHSTWYKKVHFCIVSHVYKIITGFRFSYFNCHCIRFLTDKCGLSILWFVLELWWLNNVIWQAGHFVDETARLHSDGNDCVTLCDDLSGQIQYQTAA